jgi:cellulose synthase/poly-beta-1,6-N-acetylglucosamine synthase-like glycosyltransferase/CheY-like chemotaxis protein
LANEHVLKKEESVLRVLIADGRPSIRQELKEVLAKVEGVRIVAEAGNGSEAIEQAEHFRVDVVLMSQDLPGTSADSATRRIKAKRPKTRVWILVDGEVRRIEAVGIGADGCFVNGNSHRDLIEAFKKLLAYRQLPRVISLDVKPPESTWGAKRLWTTVGIVFGFVLLASLILFPRISLPTIALICGFFFLFYGLKYYGSVALILLATSGAPNGNGNGNGLNGVFNGMGVTNGLKHKPDLEKPGLLRALVGRILGWDPNGRSNGTRSVQTEDKSNGRSLKNGNGYHFRGSEQPFISIHLPIYNETRVVDRLLEACTRLDYQNYEVLVADDSTDETIRHLEKWAKHPKVKISHRINRTGFKGAALKHAMEVMDPRARFIVVFDADFIPPPTILHQFLSYFFGVNGNNGNNHVNGKNGHELELIDEKLAVVQGYQWHVLNASENWITRGVRTEFSGSYVVERPGQELTAGMKMISGSVFMIRADLLRDVGWGTSITEDWELTIRLYLEGYRVLYSPFIQAPAECVSDFKQLARQRMRWAEGHTFNVKKYFLSILRSPRLTWREKLEFYYYVPYYLQSVLFILGTATWFISEIFLRTHLPFWTATLGWSLVFTNTFALIFMNIAGLYLERGVRRNFGGLLSFVLLTFLLVPYQAYASLKGLLEPHEGGWHRTDKTGVITDVIDRLKLGKRMRRLAPKKKPRKIDLDKRLGMPLAKLSRYLPEPLKRFTRRHGLAFRVMSSLVIGLLLLAILASQVPVGSAAPDVFYLRDTTTNGASPSGEDMNNVQGSSENTLTFDDVSDEAYWYTELTYPNGGDDASVAAGNYTFNMYFNQLPSSWWDTDYEYRQQITVTAGTTAVPSGYAVSINFNHATLVTNSKSQSDGDDIRIVFWTGSGWTELDRALQEGSAWNNNATRVWFKTQAAISASGSDNNYYLYYGNTSATSPPANKSNIYTFWDDFDDSSLGAGWSLDGIGTVSGGSTNESGTVVTISATTSGDIWSTADDAYHLARSATGNFVAESYTTGLSGSHGTWSKYGGVHLRDTTAAGSKNANMSEVYSAVGATFSYRVATNGTTSETTSANRYNYNRIIRSDGTAEGYQSNDGITWSQIGSTITFTGGLSDPVRIGPILAGLSSTSHSVDVDWFKIRPYVDPEPTTGFGSEVDAPYVQIVVSVYHTDGDGSDPQEIVTSSTITVDANTSDPYALPIGSGTEQTFTSSDPQRLRVNIDVTAVNGSGSFTLAYDSSSNASSLDTPIVTVPDLTVYLIAVVVFIPAVMNIFMRKRRLVTRIAMFMVSFLVALALLGQQVLPVSAAPDVFYLRDTTANGASPAGEDMNLNQGSSEDTLVFDDASDEAYWYTDITYPTGGDDASVAAGNYTLNMYFDQLPTWYDADWDCRKKITINASQVPGNLTNFPVLVNLSSDSDLAAGAQSDGDDVLFTTSDGTTKVSHEIEYFNGTSGALQAWVELPSVSGSNNTDFYMYYCNSGASNQEDVANTWDNGFVAVQHLAESTGTQADSTGRGNTGTLNGTTSFDSSSKIDGGRDFDGSSGYIGIANSTDINTGGPYTDRTITLWFNADSTSGRQVIFEEGAQVRGFNIYIDSGYLYVGGWNTTESGWSGTWHSTSISADTWYHVTLLLTGGTSTVQSDVFKAYVNGSSIGSGDGSQVWAHSGAINTGRSDGNLVYHDGTSTANNYYDGTVDEWRVANATRSTDWITAEYNNQNNPGGFYTLYSEVVQPTVNITVSVYHTKSDGTDPQGIVTSSSIEINCETSDPYALPIGSGSQQTFTSSDPRRLRAHIDVTSVTGSGSFTLAYDSSANPSSLDTPSMTIPEFTLYLMLLVYLIPIVTGLVTRKRRLVFRLLSVVSTIVLSLGLLATQVVPVSAEVSETTNTFWFYDDTTPQQYMMYQTQPSGSETSETTTTINFYSDTFADGWQMNSGTTSVYMVCTNGFGTAWTLTLYGGSTGDWTNLGSTDWSIPAGAKQLQSTSFSTSSYDFSSGDRLRLEVQIAFGGTAYWDGSSNDSRLVTPTLVVPEWGLLFILMVPLIPAVMAVFWRKRRLANQLVSLFLAVGVALGMVAGDVKGVSAAPDTFYLHDTNTSGTAITLDATSSNTALNTSSISWSHTIGSGNHRKLIVGVSIEEDVMGDEPVTSVTYNSVSLTYANHVTAGTGYLIRVEVWYMDEADLPSTGSYTIQVNTTGTVEEINAGAVSIAGARSGTPEATATNTNSGTASITTNITTLTNGAGVVDVVGSGNGGSFTPGTGQLELWDVSASSATGAMSGKLVASAGVTSMQQTHSTTSNRNAHVLIAVAPHDPDKSPSGKYMNTTEGSAGSMMTFDTATQSAYWYLDETWPTGNDNATIAAGDYTFNMYFNSLPTWYDSDWDCRKKITINASQVPGDLTNFPVLVNLSSDSDLAAGAQGDGDDILFTTSDGTTKVSHEIEYFNNSTGALQAWVELPNVSGSNNTDFYMYYCNSGASNQEAVANTWDNGFVSVQHLAESTGTQTDSTGRGNTGTLHGTTSFDSGSKIDGGRDFDGSSGYISMSNSADINSSGPYTDREISLWFNADTTSGRQVLFEEGAATRGFNIYIDSGYLYVGGWNTPVGESNWSGTWHSTSISADTWYHVTLMLTGGTSTVQADVFKGYLNGSQYGSGNGSQLWNHTGDIRVARSGAGSKYHDGNSNSAYYYDGTIDELRISNATRSANWIAASYNNQNNPGAFYTLDSEVVQPTVDITVSVYHTKPDGSDPQAIVTSSSTEINCDTPDPYALDIGSALQQTFTSSNPRRLRLHVYVDSVSGGGDFVLDYDGTCASNRCSNLDTPVVVVPEVVVVLVPLVLGVPILVSLLKRKKRKRVISCIYQEEGR